MSKTKTFLRVATLEMIPETLTRRALRRFVIANAVSGLMTRLQLLGIEATQADLALRIADVMLEADEQFIIDEAAKRAAKDGQGK